MPVAGDGRLRPHYWHCRLQSGLAKTLDQPWFRPFSAPPNPRLPASFRKHREGLMRVMRRDTHDRPDIWYVREDGANLAENVHDLVGGCWTGSTTHARPWSCSRVVD
jgi:hypothetical protein